MAKASDGAVMKVMEMCPRGITITDLCFSSKSTFIAFGCDDASVGIVSVKKGSIEVSIKDHDSAYSIKSVSFNCYDSLLVSGSSDGEIFVNSINLDEESQGNSYQRVFSDRS